MTVRLTNQTGTKVGYNDPIVLSGNNYCSTNKRYAGDVRQDKFYKQINPLRFLQTLLNVATKTCKKAILSVKLLEQ